MQIGWVMTTAPETISGAGSPKGAARNGQDGAPDFLDMLRQAQSPAQAASETGETVSGGDAPAEPENPEDAGETTAGKQETEIREEDALPAEKNKEESSGLSLPLMILTSAAPQGAAGETQTASENTAADKPQSADKPGRISSADGGEPVTAGTAAAGTVTAQPPVEGKTPEGKAVNAETPDAVIPAIRADAAETEGQPLPAAAAGSPRTASSGELSRDTDIAELSAGTADGTPLMDSAKNPAADSGGSDSGETREQTLLARTRPSAEKIVSPSDAPAGEQTASRSAEAASQTAESGNAAVSAVYRNQDAETASRTGESAVTAADGSKKEAVSGVSDTLSSAAVAAAASGIESPLWTDGLEQSVSDPVMSQILDKLDYEALTRGETLRIRLEPDELGGVSIRMTATGNGFAVSIVADSARVRESLNGQLDQLASALRDSGVTPGSIRVEAGARADGGTGGLMSGSDAGGYRQQSYRPSFSFREPVTADSSGDFEEDSIVQTARLNLFG